MITQEQNTKEFRDREYVRKFQTNFDKEALNNLLIEYFDNSCKYAFKFLKACVYSNMISGTFEEVESYVFIAFGNAVKNYKLESEGSLSFRNYLYQLIRFETLKEIKRHFNGQCLPKIDLKGCREQDFNSLQAPIDLFNHLNLNNKTQIICNFLSSKKKEYADIFNLKAQGLKNSEICRNLGITSAELKSRGQYIKKLIQNKYSSIEMVF